MRAFVETLESTSDSHAHNTCDKQRQLFKALYDVAAKYLEVRSRTHGSQGDMSWWSMARQQYAGASTGGTASNGPGVGMVDATTSASSYPPSHGTAADGDGMALMDGMAGPASFQSTPFGDADMDMDFSGAELWDWFNKNQSIMRILEDT